MRDIYTIQPYEVGSKKYKSLALIIPSNVKKECNIDKSSIFKLTVDEQTKQIVLSGPLSVFFFKNTKSKNEELIGQYCSDKHQSIPLGGK